LTVTLNLKPEIEACLLAHADAAGMSLEAYLQRLVERELAAVEGDPHRRRAAEWSGKMASSFTVPECPYPLVWSITPFAVPVSNESCTF